jgi:hypothetical protein
MQKSRRTGASTDTKMDRYRLGLRAIGTEERITGVFGMSGVRDGDFAQRARSTSIAASPRR